MRGAAPTWRTFRGKSLFFRTLLILLLLCILTALYFGIFAGRAVTREQTDRVQELHLLSLKRTANELDTLFETYAKSVARTLWSPDFIGAMVTSEPQTTERSRRIVHSLDSYVRENSLITTALFYLPYADAVYHATGGYFPLEYSVESEPIAKLSASLDRGTAAGQNAYWQMQRDGERVFLTVHLAISNTIGIVFLEVDRAALARMVHSGADTAVTTSILDPSFSPLVGESPQDAKLRSRLESALPEGVWEAGDSLYCATTSTASGWVYLSHTARTRPSTGTIARLVLPAVLVYCLVNALLALSITRGTYRPIQRLMEIAMQEGHAGPEVAANESDFLELAYTGSLHESERYSRLIDSISRDVLEQRLRKIISSRDVEEISLRETLEGIGQKELIDRRVQVLCAHLSFSTPKRPGEMELGLCQRSVLAAVASVVPEGATAHALFFERDRLAVFLFCEPSASVTSIKMQQMRFVDCMQKKLAASPFSLHWGTGRVCNGMAGSRDSFLEACSELNHKLAVSRDAADLAEQPPEPPAESTGIYYTQKLRRIVPPGEFGQAVERQPLINSLIHEVADNADGAQPDEVRKHYEMVLDGLIDWLVSCRITLEEMQRYDLDSGMKALQHCRTTEEMQNHMLQFSERALGVVAANSGKRSYQYIEKAKEYIAEHYMDSGLSLSEVSGAIGISAPYLSQLFVEIARQKFLAYLTAFRLEQAKQYLRASNLTITQIAGRCGFNSIQTFGRVFKKQLGISPRQYRRDL